MPQQIETLTEADATLAAHGERVGVRGLEAVVIGAIAGLGRADWWVPGPRERAGAALRGVPMERVVDPAAVVRPYKVGASLPLRALHAVGLALAEPERHVLVHLGLGALPDGATHEALNLAAQRRARVIFLVAARSLDGAPVPAQLACPAEAWLSALAAAWGVRMFRCDGGDALAVAEVVREARGVGGPSIVLADL